MVRRGSCLALAAALPGHTSWSCWTSQRIEPGQSRQLFQDFYGEYPFSFDNDGDRAATREVGLVILFGDDAGRVGSLEVAAPIEPGGLPSTHSGGGAGKWSCTPER